MSFFFEIVQFILHTLCISTVHLFNEIAFESKTR